MITKQDVDRVKYGYAFIDDSNALGLLRPLIMEILFIFLMVFDVAFCLWWWEII